MWFRPISTAMFVFDNSFVAVMIAAICFFKPWKDYNIRTFLIVIAIIVADGALYHSKQNGRNKTTSV
ncbi:hypothetical protein [Rahnella bruchi]|uniref:hypothetical protein n=1 Tax=Rahnella bruchi TaxID=1510573 RepID=UPI0013C4612C|nr:hypothetical protein [Rahnella bruchi]